MQIAKLDGIGFDWGSTMTAEQRWNENFEAVRRFRHAHGRWPKRSEGTLGTWCINQRRAKKGKGHNRISPAQVTKLDGIGFDWGKTTTSQETVEPAGPAAEPQQPMKAAPPRKRVHEADPEGRAATRRATGLHPLPMAATAAFWTATPVAVALDAEHAATPDAGASVVQERAGRKAPLRVTTSDDGTVIKTNF